MRNFVLALSLMTLVTGASLTPADAMPRAGVELYDRPNAAEIVQIGHRNRAERLHRRAARQQARQVLRGRANRFASEQHGYANAAAGSRHGSGNDGVIEQFGNGNLATTQQDGNLNSAFTSQTGNGQSATVTQSGTGNVTIIFQYSR